MRTIKKRFGRWSVYGADAHGAAGISAAAEHAGWAGCSMVAWRARHDDDGDKRSPARSARGRRRAHHGHEGAHGGSG